MLDGGVTPGEHCCKNAPLFVEPAGPIRIVRNDADSVGHL
jgi:hypothetical protein